MIPRVSSWHAACFLLGAEVLMVFMHEGGVGMWVMLAVAVGAAAWATRRRSGDVARGGAGLVLALGLLGASAGLTLTAGAARASAPEDQATILAVGIDESVNNTILAALLSLGLGALSVGLRRREVAA